MKPWMKFVVGLVLALVSMWVSKAWPDWSWHAGWFAACGYFWLVIREMRREQARRDAFIVQIVDGIIAKLDEA